MAGMKQSTIKLVLRNKIEDWLSTITDESVRNLTADNVIVSGGAIASMLGGEKVNDYDVYFRNKETVVAIANYYVTLFNTTIKVLKTGRSVFSCNPVVKEDIRKNIKGLSEERVSIYMKSSGVAGEKQEEYRYFEGEEGSTSVDQFFDSLNADPLKVAEGMKDEARDKTLPKYRPVFFSENAITLSGKIQLVTRFYGEPSEIHENYDYVHAMCYYDYKKDSLVLHQQALECILSKTLVYGGSLYPIASIFRVRKFIERGWRITAGQLLKIIMQLNAVDLSDPAILREQLVGVDQAYMWQLLRALESEDKTRIDAAYLAKLVDEIFE